jgi:cyclophilin family peptidyl-prolyl cis-trans isomerase
MKSIVSLFVLTLLLLLASCSSQKRLVVKNSDRKKDIELQTTAGTMILRLSDSTPLHRDNFLKLVKSGFYDSVLFHRVINRFMIQGGDDQSKRAVAGTPLGNGGAAYMIDAEFRNSLFHKKGALAAARQGDDVNPAKKSSGSQFYIVQGRVHTDASLDSVENFRLKRKLPTSQREVYKNLGGTPHLDQNYTVFGEMVYGFDVLDKIAGTPTSKGADRDRPLQDVRIIKARLVKRRNY